MRQIKWMREDMGVEKLPNGMRVYYLTIEEDGVSVRVSEHTSRSLGTFDSRDDLESTVVD
jgi:hypothetical protein